MGNVLAVAGSSIAGVAVSLSSDVEGVAKRSGWLLMARAKIRVCAMLLEVDRANPNREKFNFGHDVGKACCCLISLV